jgi:hypothetical protein
VSKESVEQKINAPLDSYVLLIGRYASLLDVPKNKIAQVKFQTTAIF